MVVSQVLVSHFPKYCLPLSDNATPRKSSTQSHHDFPPDIGYKCSPYACCYYRGIANVHEFRNALSGSEWAPICTFLMTPCLFIVRLLIIRTRALLQQAFPTHTRSQFAVPPSSSANSPIHTSGEGPKIRNIESYCEAKKEYDDESKEIQRSIMNKYLIIPSWTYRYVYYFKSNS